LDAITADCREAVRFLFRNAGQLQLAPDRLSVLGHSAAGQLTAMVASTVWSELGLPDRVVRSWVGVSGFYDIEPFAQTGFQPLVGFSSDEYQRGNPMRHVRAGIAPALLVTGAQESELIHEFATSY